MKGIYKIENIINHKIYIGKANNIKERWKQHIDALNKNCHCNSHLQNSWNKYGPEKFNFEIIELCSEKEINEKEKYWINYYGGINSKKTFNIIEGGLGGAGNKEWKKKISETVKNHYLNGDYDCRKKGTTCWIKKGKVHHRINKAQLEYYLSRGWKLGRLPIKNTDKFKKFGKDNGFFGKHHSEESKQKMRKRHNISLNTHNRLSKFTSKRIKKLKWINNGKINKRVENSKEYLNKGWKLGRLPLPQIGKSLKIYFESRRNKI